MKSILFSFFLLLSGNSLLIAGSPESLFPKIDNFNLDIDTTVYNPDDLWELIDGAADVFLLYHFQDLHIGEYTNDENITIRVEIYRHLNPDNTFGIYASERMPDYNFINIGVEGYISYQALNFFTGDYYVKMNWSGTGQSDKLIMKQIAQQIEKQLNQHNIWPMELSLFPDVGKIDRSEGYSSENFMGYSFLHNAFTTGYKINNSEIKLFVIDQKNIEEAKSTLQKYFEIIKNNYSNLNENEFLAEDPYNGKVGIGISGNYLYGVINSDDTVLIKNSLNKLKDNIGQ